MPRLLSLEKISLQFGGVQALRDVSLTLRPAGIHGLAGENGSGKSTLIKIISGVNRPDAGQILIGSQRYRSLRPIEAIRLGIQVIYQDLALFPNLSVAENLALNDLVQRRCKIVRRGAMREQARRGMARLGLTLDLDQRVGELSIAQRQLVAIARALLQEARLIIMDEPTSALTGRETGILLEVMNQLKAQGVSILFVSHKLREMRAVSDRFTVLRNGRVVAEGSAEEFDEAALARHMTGRQLKPERAHLEERPGRALALEVKGLSGPRLHDVSLELRAGEILGVTGLLGSGQADLAEALFGLRPASAGSIRVRGEPHLIRRPEDAVAAGIAYVPEDRLTEGLFLAQSVEQNIIAADLGPVRSRLGWISPSAISRYVDHWLRELNIQTASGSLPVSALSGGNQQRVLLARWLATNPDILILNGPSVGVDVGSKEGIHRQLREFATRGMAILMISDDLPELTGNCERVLVMQAGRIVYEWAGGDPTQLAEHLLSFA